MKQVKLKQIVALISFFNLNLVLHQNLHYWWHFDQFDERMNKMVEKKSLIKMLLIIDIVSIIMQYTMLISGFSWILDFRNLYCQLWNIDLNQWIQLNFRFQKSILPTMKYWFERLCLSVACINTFQFSDHPCIYEPSIIDYSFLNNQIPFVFIKNNN